MNAWKIILATLVIFGAGVITGGLLVGYSDRAWRQPRRPPVTNQRTPAAAQNPGAREPNRLPAPLNGPLRRDFLDRLDAELKLSPEQRDRIEKIISEGQEQARETWLQIEPQVRQEIRRTRERIRAELSAEQQARFEELLRTRPRNPQRPNAARGATNSASN